MVNDWTRLFEDDYKYEPLTHEDCNIYLNNYALTMASDGFLPFEDNIYEADKFNIKHIIQPGGSIRDDRINKLSKSFDINMVMTGKRLFTH